VFEMLTKIDARIRVQRTKASERFHIAVENSRAQRITRSSDAASSSFDA
jgi:hypothetical protein